MTFDLQNMIREASMELGSDACRNGKHQWQSEGGRGCPHDLTDNCGQAVYRCTTCGQHDYGEQGGPGHDDCERHCEHKGERAVKIMLDRRDPFDLAWTSATSSARLYHRTLLRALRRQPKRRLP